MSDTMRMVVVAAVVAAVAIWVDHQFIHHG
jgi:hypothetical protein